MLVARRDPPFESGAHTAPHVPSGHAAARGTRVMNMLQLVGSLLAIPVGLASAYSIYHTNFTVEARCESLRANIVSMLDKNADASTLRMLVRRDVLAFETSCGSVDADAVAAFKTLLAAGKSATPQPQPAPESIRQQSVAAKPAPEKAPPPVAEAKPARQEAEVKPVRRDAETRPPRREADAKSASRELAPSDAQWLEAVRGALVHAPATPAKEKVVAPTAASPARPLGELSAKTAAPAAAPAPALAPATSVTATTPAPAADNDHPVPPASIPDAMVSDATAALPAAKPERSRIKALISDIPLLGRMVDR